MEQMVAQLLQRKDKLKCYIRDSDGQNAWHKAAKYGHCKILKQFIEFGINPELRIGETPEHYDPSEKMKSSPGYGNTALHMASKYGEAEVVAYLLKEFPKMMSIQNYAGATALSLATTYGQWRTMELIIQRSMNTGIDAGINTPEATRLRPIHYVVIDKSGKCMDVLIRQETPLEHGKDVEDMTPLHFAAIHGIAVHIQKLHDNGFSATRRTKDGQITLELAVKNANWQTFKALWMLCNKKALLNDCDKTRIQEHLRAAKPPKSILELVTDSEPASSTY